MTRLIASAIRLRPLELPMTRVDFYVLGENVRGGVGATVCRLAAKAYEQGHRVFIAAASDEEATQLDTMLWTFRDVAFVPHARHVDAHPPEAPVLIGCGDPPGDHADVMINLSHPVPAVFSRFERVVEIVPNEPAGRDAARGRYRFYQERGYSLDSHKLD